MLIGNNNRKKATKLPDDIKDKIAEHIKQPIYPKYATTLLGKQDVDVIKQFIAVILALPPNAAQKPLQLVLEAIATEQEPSWCLAGNKPTWAKLLSQKLRAMRRHFDKAVRAKTKWAQELLADRGVGHVPDEEDSDSDDEDEMDDQDSEGPTADLKATRKTATSTAGGPEPTPAPAGTQQSDGFYTHAWDAELQAACSYTYTHNILICLGCV